PRTLDIDILLYEEEVIREENLRIPHIEMHKRSFVLEPLVQIAPQAKHPLLQKTVYELWNSL
ncbi:MAG: 2-amino-4-hydroxy-6-hydroxymethyldihydropteridine diphosphokinase, partial [Acetivibrio ethanolgignens]